MTKEEEKEIERVFKKPISKIDWFDIPTYIRKRDEEEAMTLAAKEEEWREEKEEEEERERLKNIL